MGTISERCQNIIKTLPYKNWSLAVLVINLLVLLVVVTSQNALPPTVPLFYGRPYGAEQLARASHLIIPNSIALTVSLSSLTIAKMLQDEFLKQVLFGTMVVCTALATITTFKIIFLIA